MEYKLYSPAIHLFAFHVVKVPNADSITNKIHPELLWDNCYKILKEFGIEQQLQLRSNVPENSREDLLDGKTPDDFLLNLETKISDGNKEIELEGFVYPLQIYDSYALVLSIGYPEPQEEKLAEAVDISLLKQLNPNYCLLPNEIKSSLGQTLLITAWLDQAQKQQGDNFLRELADKCIEELIPKAQKCPPFYRKGKLFSSSIFEYGLIREPESYCHVLVLFFDEPATNKTFWDYHQILIDIFFYRNKVIKNFWNSRDTYQKVYSEYEEIENLINNTLKIVPQEQPLDEQTLNKLKTQLKQILQKSLEYAGLLRDLGFYSNSIAINADNYKEKLRIINNKLTFESKPDLSFLKTFAEENSPHFQGQIQADLGYLVHGSGLLDKAIASIRGIVEIDQAERDRQLQQTLRNNEAAEKERDRILQQQLRQRELAEAERDRNLETTIAVAGVGLAVTEIVAGSTSYLIPQTSSPIQPPFTSATLHPFTQSLLLSLFFGLAAAGITWGAITGWQRYSDNKAKLEGSDHRTHKQ